MGALAKSGDWGGPGPFWAVAWLRAVIPTVLLFGSLPSRAEQFEIFHSMTEGGGPNGSPVQASDGKIYGTTDRGGNFDKGSIYVLTPDGQGGWIFSTFHSFRGPDGATPRDGLIQAKDGNLYGTTSYGGASDLGTVFTIDLSGNLTLLHSFSGPDGSLPSS